KRSARRLSDIVLGTSGIGAERSWEYRFNPCENRLTPRQNAQQIPDERELGTRPSFHHVTIALPDALADQFPGCGGILRAGLAAMKIHLLWDFLTGSILQLRITPGRASDATNPIAQEVAPAGSLSLFDLGYFCLDRFQNLTRAGAFWISRLQHGTSVFDAQGQPLALLQYLRQQTGSGPIDVSVLLGVSHRLPCRLIALRVPQEVADRRRQKAYVKAQKHGRVPSR